MTDAGRSVKTAAKYIGKWFAGKGKRNSRNTRNAYWLNQSVAGLIHSTLNVGKTVNYITIKSV